MGEDEQLRSLMFLTTYLLLKRRRDLISANVQRRDEIQRRIRHRQYFFQRQRRMLMMMMAGGLRSHVRIRTRPWTTTPSSDWWERVVMTEFQPSDWLDKFRMSRETFLYLCDKLRPRLARQDTSFRLALPVEKRVAVALWRLASNIEYRTISALFGVGKSTVCRCVRDMCHAIVALLSSIYLRPPSEQELKDSAQLFGSFWGFPHCIAAIATLHTAIITPSSNASDYANPAGWLSVLSQVGRAFLHISDCSVQIQTTCAAAGGRQRPRSLLGRLCQFPRWDRSSRHLTKLISVGHCCRRWTVSSFNSYFHGETPQVELLREVSNLPLVKNNNYEMQNNLIENYYK